MPFHAEPSAQACASLRALADEILRSIAEVVRVLDTLAVPEADPSAEVRLAEAEGYLSEVQGALVLIDQPGLAALAQLLLTQLPACAPAGAVQAAQAAGAARRVRQVMQAALDALLSGRRPMAGELLACWQRVAALGSACELHPSELVSLAACADVVPALPPLPARALPPDASEQALLSFLRAQHDSQRSDAAQRIAEVLAHACAQASDADECARWRALQGYFVEFAQSHGDTERAKKIVASTARALRRVGHGRTALAAAARAALFELARQDCRSDEARQVARLFDLHGQFAAKDGGGPEATIADESALAFAAQVTATIAAIENDPDGLLDPGRWIALADAAQSSALLVPLAEPLRHIASRLAGHATASREALAAALLCVQACAAMGECRSHRICALADALRKRDDARSLSRMKAWTRQAGAHRLMLDLSATLRSEMAAAEQVLDAGSDTRAARVAAVAMLANIAGTLQMLAAEEERDAVLALRSRIVAADGPGAGIDDEIARQWVRMQESFMLLPWRWQGTMDEPVEQQLHEPADEPADEQVGEPIVEQLDEPADELSDEPAATAIDAAPSLIVDEGCDSLDAIFISEASALLSALRAHADTADPAVLVHAAHTLAGCSSTVGAAGIAELALALEHVAAHEQALAPALLRATLDAIDAMLAEFAATGRCSANAQLIAQWRASAAEQADVEAYGPCAEPPTGIDDEASMEPTQALEPARAPSLLVSEEVDESRAAHANDTADTPHDGEAELLAIFNEEAADLLPQVEQAVRAWQRRPDDREQPAQLLRVLHTLKGSARMAGRHELGEDFHQAEAEIGALAQQAPPAVASQLPALLERVDRWLQATSGTPSKPVAKSQADVGDPVAAPAAAQQTETPSTLLRVRADRLAQFADSSAEIWIGNARIREGLQEQRRAVADLSDDLARLRSQLRELEIEAESRILSRAAQGSSADFDPLEFDRYTRLHELTRMMAESITDIAGVQRALVRQVEGLGAAASAQARDLRRQQAELQALRSQALQSVDARLRHLLRQASREAGRDTELVLDGGQVEIERGLLDRLLGPLEHLLRNAVVHGIEPPDERERCGKPRTGKVTLAASQAGNELRLTLSDDGRGIDAERIRERALAVGLLREPDAPDARALAALIFAPGFSTASEVTALSGRGIGMDAVRVELQALGGRIDVDSEPGRGCRFTIRLPASLASVQVILASAGRWRIALPASLLQRVLQLDPVLIKRGDDGGQIDWQGGTVRLLHLGVALGDAVPQSVAARVPVAVLRDGEHLLAVQLDAIDGQREVIVKHPGAQLAQVPGLAGATVLGDGGIALVIDPFRLPAIALPASPLVEERRAPLVLVVDDSLTVRRASQRLLERHGYAVALARDGLEALEQLQQQQPAAVLLDIEMPRMDGFELLAALRDDARLRSLPVVMITSRIAERHRERAATLGATAYMGKPYDEEALLALLADVCAAQAAA